MKLAAFSVLALALSGCATSMVEPVGIDADELTATTPAEGGPGGDKIIGVNDLTKVLEDGANIPAKYRPLIDAFGTISVGCTATHIGNGIVITAGHCFGAPRTRKDNVACTGKTVKWGVRHDKASYLTSKCETILTMEQNSDRDYAIFKVSPAPTAKLEVDIAARPAVDTTLTIFSHPQLRPLEWSKTCPLKPASAGGWGLDQFSHQCDTEPGSSGATVLDDTTLKVVGIHDGGLNPWNYGTYLSDTPLDELLSLTVPAPVEEPETPAGEPAAQN